MTKRLRFVDDFIANKRIARTSLDRRALVDLKEAIEENCDELTVSRRAIKVFEVGLSDTFLKEYGDMQNQALRRSEEVYSLEISNKQECNAVLFIFDTDHVQKLPLKVSSSSCPDVLEVVQCVISTDSLFDLLRENNMRLPPPHGTIIDKGSKGNLRILIYKFDRDHVTPCSKASSYDFKLCNEKEERKFEAEMKLERNVSWSFFCLNANPNLDLKEHFIEEKTLHLKPLFVYPDPKNEAVRMNKLYDSLVLYSTMYSVEKIDKPGNTECFCQFTGGGDIFISMETESLVISNVDDGSQSSQQQDDGPHSAQRQDDDSPYFSHPSPKESTHHMSGFTVEGKETEATSRNHLKYQLFADMVLNCVVNFITNCINKYDEAFIRNVECVVGYGAPYTGSGHIGFYKLELKFGHTTKFVTKLQLEKYSQPTAAAFLDAILDYLKIK